MSVAVSKRTITESNDALSRHARTLLFLGLHVPLAFLVSQHPLLATAHALMTLAVGVWLVLTRPLEDTVQIQVVGYIAGSEILWRMTNAYVFYEFGKYAVVLILGLAILRRYRNRTLPAIPVFYFLYLVPAVIPWFGKAFGIARRRISFTLSGPLSLAISSIYFASRELDADERKELAISVVGPVIATATLVIHGLITAGSSLRFGRSSLNNAFVGWGTNQLSNLLALGVIFCWLWAVEKKTPFWIRVLGVTLMSGFLTLAIITFSRGGVLISVLALAATLPFLLSGQKNRWFVLLVVLCLLGAFVYLVIPWIVDLTGGMAVERYSDTDTTDRLELALSELRLWLDHPTGVGVGRARYYVDEYALDHDLMAHVEYTRLVAEHGILGLLSLALLMVGAWVRYTQADNLASKTWTVALLCYALLYMGHSSMRTVAPGLLYGITWAGFLSQEHETGT
jgi:O-antigen ligase